MYLLIYILLLVFCVTDIVVLWLHIMHMTHRAAVGTESLTVQSMSVCLDVVPVL